MLAQIKSLGFNTIRIPFANEMLRNTSSTNGISFQANPDLYGLSPLQCLDKIISYSGNISLRVLLDRQSSKSNGAGTEALWYIPNDPYYTEKRIVSDLVMLAQRYLGTAVIGLDLWNAPGSGATWGTGSALTDWNLAAERFGNAIQAVNPYLLIIVQGIQNGNDLTGVAEKPVKLSVPAQVVYSTPEYSNDLYVHDYFSDPTFPANLRDIWTARFGYLIMEQIAPVIISEFGTSFANPSDTPWLSTWMNYLNGQFLEDGQSQLPPGHMGISWSYQQLAPYGPVGGILGSDWQTVQTQKLAAIASGLGPLFPFVDRSVPFVPPPANKTSVVPDPTLTPTAAPTQYPYEYFHTSGNQIVNREGKTIRIAGVNW